MDFFGKVVQFIDNETTLEENEPTALIAIQSHYKALEALILMRFCDLNGYISNVTDVNLHEVSTKYLTILPCELVDQEKD